MNRQRLMRKWAEEASISALYAQVDARPVRLELEHDDGRFRIYQAGPYLFLAGETTATRPLMRKTAAGWEPLEPRLTALALELTKQYPEALPGKSSGRRTQIMREMVAQTPKGLGLGDTALWSGLVAHKDFDFEAKHPRDEQGQFASKPDPDGPVSRPGSGPDTRSGTQKLVNWQEDLLRHSTPLDDHRDDRIRYAYGRFEELQARYKTDPGFQKLIAEEKAKAQEEEELYGRAQDVRTDAEIERDTLDQLRGAWFVDVAATATTGAMQQIAAEEFKLADTHHGTPSYMQAAVNSMLERHGDFLRRVVRDTYADTQKLLQEQNITSLDVVRGMRGLGGMPVGHHQDVALKSLALTSWTTKQAIADRFTSTPGVILKTTVPAAKIFSIGGHGLVGESGEFEAVLIGDQLRGEVWAWTAQEGSPPEGVAKMSLTLNIDEDPANANWLHAKSSLRDQVKKAVTGQFEEHEHPRDDEGKFAPKGTPEPAPKPAPVQQEIDLPPSLSIPGLTKPKVSTGPVATGPVEAKPKAKPEPRVITPEEMRPPKYPVVPFKANLGSKTFPNGTKLSVDEGDLLGAPVEAIVNPANSELAHGGGVAGAIRTKGGYIIQVMSDNWVKKHGKASTRRAAVTAAGSLPQRAIVHAVAPIYTDGKHGEAKEMEEAYFSALRSANVNNFTSIAFPSLGTGIFGNPLSLGTAAAMAAVKRFDETYPTSPLKQIHIVVRPEDKDTHEAFGNMINDRPVIDKPKPLPVEAKYSLGRANAGRSVPSSESTPGGWYKPGKINVPGWEKSGQQIGLPLEPKSTGGDGKPLVSTVVSEQILELADSLEASDKPLATAVADLEAELFRGNVDSAKSAFEALPREIREMLPASVVRVFSKPAGGGWYGNLRNRVEERLKGTGKKDA